MKSIRLDKYLADMSIGTRSEVKKLIKSKRVRVNDTIVRDSSVHVTTQEDSVYVDDQLIPYEEFAYYMLNKPAGYVSAVRDAGPTVMDLFFENEKGLFPCGRLDKDTTGLLLITNDGILAHNLLSPRKHIWKTYFVTTRDEISDSTVEAMEKGITIDGDELCKPAVIQRVSSHSCYLKIHEGKYHQVKRMFLAAGNEVISLQRTEMKNLVLDESLKPGEYRRLSMEEIAGLRESPDESPEG